MTRFIRHPHLPDNPVRLCAIGAGQPYIQEALERQGIEVLLLQPCGDLPQPVRHHTDLLLHHAGDDVVWLNSRKDEKIVRILEKLGFSIRYLQHALGGEYPLDVPLCCFAVENSLYCNPKTIDKELLKYYQLVQGRRVVPVKQGYAKCSVCAVDEHSIITSDEGIAQAATANGLQVLHIRPGHILLPGYSYGFIGGCCGKLDKWTMAFCGNIAAHPDAAVIEEFCTVRKVSLLSLCPELPLTDIGGIIPLLQVD